MCVWCAAIPKVKAYVDSAAVANQTSEEPVLIGEEMMKHLL